MVPIASHTLAPHAPLVEAVGAIERSHRRIAVVVDADGRLCGTLTDGDVRRCLLAGGTLETPVRDAMNPSPLVAVAGTSPTELLEMMRQRNVLAIPLVTPERRFQSLVHLSDLASSETLAAASGFDFAVIMAGGEGVRLRPITQTIPKPMVEIGGTPLLERQIRKLTEASLKKVFISVNYLAHVIEDHFGTGEGFDIEIGYLREERKMGTAGALSLLPQTPERPIVVMNGDVVTTCDFGNLYEFHESHGAWITAAAIDYHVNIPYGVLLADGPFVAGLQEKPSQRFLCNAGIYAVAPQALELLPPDHYNMTDLIDACLEAGQPVAVFPVHEYWSDIGTPDDLEKARAFFSDKAKIE